jgi:hypothetical protein
MASALYMGLTGQDIVDAEDKNLLRGRDVQEMEYPDLRVYAICLKVWKQMPV